jgi:hypothetical protein
MARRAGGIRCFGKIARAIPVAAGETDRPRAIFPSPARPHHRGHHQGGLCAGDKPPAHSAFPSEGRDLAGTRPAPAAGRRQRSEDNGGDHKAHRPTSMLRWSRPEQPLSVASLSG